jgi:tRNA(His) 5'-end guanylyltransferase
MTAKTKTLADRMKDYEGAVATVLPPRFPIILRVAGKAFHTYTRGCKQKPFDLMFNWAMDQVALDLVNLIQGAELAYVQSDEVSVLIHPYKRFTSQGWFDSKVQKMVSVSAAQAAVTMTMMSNRIFEGETRPALFDARVFILPEADVANYFVWRQQDAERNSTQMLARNAFGHKDIHGKSVKEMREMCRLIEQPWEKCDQGAISGRLVRKVVSKVRDPFDGTKTVERSQWQATPARHMQWQDVVRPRLATEE